MPFDGDDRGSAAVRLMSGGGQRVLADEKQVDNTAIVVVDPCLGGALVYLGRSVVPIQFHHRRINADSKHVNTGSVHVSARSQVRLVKPEGLSDGCSGGTVSPIRRGPARSDSRLNGRCSASPRSGRQPSVTAVHRRDPWRPDHQRREGSGRITASRGIQPLVLSMFSSPTASRSSRMSLRRSSSSSRSERCSIRSAIPSAIAFSLCCKA